MKTGFIFEEQVPEDFQFGAERSLETKFGGEVLTNGDWRPFLFDGIYSHQAPGYETNSCVSHGTANALELLRRRLFQYDQDLSDRFIAKVSETDPARGNTPKKVGEAIRKNFTVFEQEWSTKDATSTDDFYKDIPQNLKTLATGRGAEWEFGYEYVPLTRQAIREALKYSPLGMSVPAWFEEDGLYYRPGVTPDSHWTCAIYMDAQDQIYILDSYEPFIKIMRADFMPQVAMKYHLKRQIVNQDWFTKFLTWLHSWVFTSPTGPVTEVPKVEVKETVPKKESKITLWAEAIADFESGGDTNSISHRHNNPGNIKNSEGSFIVYPTYEAGFAALCNYLVRACTNDHKAYVQKAAQLKLRSSGDLTLYQFIQVYAPDPEPIPTNYSNFIAQRCGVTKDTPIKSLL